MNVGDMLKLEMVDVSFNRYMVECEWKKEESDTSFKFVLIDTWWNVNKVRAKVFEEGKGFNRYMVECE